MSNKTQKSGKAHNWDIHILPKILNKGCVCAVMCRYPTLKARCLFEEKNYVVIRVPHFSTIPHVAERTATSRIPMRRCATCSTSAWTACPTRSTAPGTKQNTIGVHWHFIHVCFIQVTMCATPDALTRLGACTFLFVSHLLGSDNKYQ